MSHIAELLTAHPYRLGGLNADDRLGLFLGLAQQLPIALAESRDRGRSMRLRVVTREATHDPLWMSAAVNRLDRTVRVFPVGPDPGTGFLDLPIDEIVEVVIYEV